MNVRAGALVLLPLAPGLHMPLLCCCIYATNNMLHDNDCHDDATIKTKVFLFCVCMCVCVYMCCWNNEWIFLKRILTVSTNNTSVVVVVVLVHVFYVALTIIIRQISCRHIYIHTLSPSLALSHTVHVGVCAFSLRQYKLQR